MSTLDTLKKKATAPTVPAQATPQAPIQNPAVQGQTQSVAQQDPAQAAATGTEIPAGYVPFFPNGVPTPGNLSQAQLNDLRTQQEAGKVFWQVIEPPKDAKDQEMGVSQAGKEFLATYEKPEQEAYKDNSGFLTIGVGHLISRQHDGVPTKKEWAEYDKLGYPRDKLTKEQMYELYDKDLKPRVDGINAALEKPVTQEMFDALISMSFNAGTDGIANSQAVKALNRGDYQEFPAQAYRWNKQRLKPGTLPVKTKGLMNRRLKEMITYAVPYVPEAKPADKKQGKQPVAQKK